MPTPARKTVVGMSDDYLKKSTAFMLEDLAKSGLEPSDMEAFADEVNVETQKERRALVTASYTIPFYDLDGKQIGTMWRRKRELKPGADKLKNLGKYTQPHMTMAEGFGHYPYIPPSVWKTGSSDGVLHLCEGEKKTASLIKFAGVRAVGLTGKDVSAETVRVLCDVIKKLGDVRRVCIWPDADVRRFDVVRSYGKLSSRMSDLLYDQPEIKIDVMKPTWDARKWKGIDDALVGGWQLTPSACELVVGEELPLDIKTLADQIGLDYVVSEKGGLTVTLNEDNICRLLEHEPLWGSLSMNLDDGSWLVGDSTLDLESDGLEVTRRLQRVFGLRKVTNDLVMRCLGHVCARNARSMWAEWLDTLEWDGVRRLDSWLVRACGAPAGDDFVAEAGEKWLCSIVARSMSLRNGAAVDWMLILYGDQGCGKTSLPKALIPEEFSQLVMSAPHNQDKDLQAAAGMCRVLVFDEMAHFFSNQANTEFIKGFVTEREDVFRPPYGRANVRRVRGSVLYGTTNRPDVIRADESGYRRWVIVDVRGIVDSGDGIAPQFDWKWLETWREQLWAEAVVRWKSGAVDVSQVRGASARTKARAVIQSPDWDDYMALLGSQPSGDLGLIRPRHGGGWFVSNPAFKLAHTSMFGREPKAISLRQFWDYWGCTTAMGAKGIRGRTLSDKLLKAIEWQG